MPYWIVAGQILGQPMNGGEFSFAGNGRPWQPRGGRSPGVLLVADGRCLPAGPPATEDEDVAGIRFALAAEGMRLDRERCAGTVWRMTLPKFDLFEGEAP